MGCTFAFRLCCPNVLHPTYQMHNEIIRPSGDVVQLEHRVTKATVQGWFNRSIGEGTQAILWDVQIDAVIGGEAYSDNVRFTVSLF